MNNQEDFPYTDKEIFDFIDKHVFTSTVNGYFWIISGQAIFGLTVNTEAVKMTINKTYIKNSIRDNDENIYGLDLYLNHNEVIFASDMGITEQDDETAVSEKVDKYFGENYNDIANQQLVMVNADDDTPVDLTTRMFFNAVVEIVSDWKDKIENELKK